MVTSVILINAERTKINIVAEQLAEIEEIFSLINPVDTQPELQPT